MRQWTKISCHKLLRWLELCSRKFSRWRLDYGKVRESGGLVPRDHWIDDWERCAIIAFARQHPLEGYRALSFMMLDADVVAVSPATTYRVLKAAGLMRMNPGRPSRKGSGFVQPLQPHQHWHIDFSYINIGGTFYFLCGVLDG